MISVGTLTGANPICSASARLIPLGQMSDLDALGGRRGHGRRGRGRPKRRRQDQRALSARYPDSLVVPIACEQLGKVS